MSRTNSSLTIFQQVVTVLLGVFLFQTITPTSFRCAAQTLPENVPLLNQTGVVGVWIWNTTNPYSPVSDFRDETDREYYTVWPEDIPGHSFQFPCEDRASKLMLENFTYPGSGGLIRTVQYFDLGIVKHYRPYWIRPTECLHCWYWDKRPGWTPIYCERGDVSNLYMSRAMSTILHGLRFGVVMVLIQLAAFVVLAILIPVYFQNRSQSFRKMAPLTVQRLQCLNWGATFVESLHLLALAVAGFLLVEGYGHTGDWRAWSMNTLAYYYRVQTACAFVASLLRQCANSITSNLTVQSGNNACVQTEEEKKKKEKEKEEMKEKKKKLPLEMLIGQVVVCVVMVEYLYLTDDEYLDFLIQVVFGVVTVAVTFTMSTVIEVGASSLWSIVKALWRLELRFGCLTWRNWVTELGNWRNWVVLPYMRS